MATTTVPVPNPATQPQGSASASAPGAAQAPSVAGNVPAVAAAAQSLSPQPGVTGPATGPAPKAPVTLSRMDKALLFAGSLRALQPAVTAIVKQDVQNQQTRNQHVIDTVWSSIQAQTAARNRMQMQLKPIVDQIDQHMKDAQALPDSDPTKIQQIGYLAHLHQQVVGEVVQQKQIVMQNQQTITALLSDKKNAKLLSKAIGYDEKNANTPERQQLIAAIQKSNPGIGKQQAGVESSLPVEQSTVPGTGVPEKLQPDVLKAAGTQAQIEEKGQEAQTKLALSAEEAKATEAYRAATLELNQAKLAAQSDPNNPVVQAKVLDSQSRALSAQAAMLRAKNSPAVEAASPELIDRIGTGKLAPEKLSYLLTRNPQLLSQVAAKYPDFDSSKAAAYPQVYRDYTSTKAGTAGGALNAGGTALVHLKELQGLNTKASHIPGTPAYTAYKNKVDTVSAELAKFYGDATVPAINAIKSTLMSTLLGNRNAAITTQAKSMGDKLDQYEQSWKNAAPSPAYEAPMPNVSAAAKKARAALDPSYNASGSASGNASGQAGASQHKVGDVVMVGGKRVKITAIDANGNAQGIPQ